MWPFSLLLRVFDPAGAYMRPDEPPPWVRRAPHGPAGISFGAAPEPAWDPRGDELVRRRQREHERLLAEHGDALRAAAHTLLATRRAAVPLPDRTLEARLVTFWRGDAVLEVTAAVPSGSMTTMVRVDRAVDADRVVGYLADAATSKLR